jgi:hypothetical protein
VAGSMCDGEDVRWQRPCVVGRIYESRGPCTTGTQCEGRGPCVVVGTMYGGQNV